MPTTGLEELIVSTMNKKRKNFRNGLGKSVQNSRRLGVYYLTIIARASIVVLPLSVARRVGAVLGVLACYLVFTERRKALESIELGLGNELSRKEQKRLCRKVFANAGRSAVEAMFMSAGKADQVCADCRVEGIEHVEKILDSGQGIVGLTAHFGNWELMLTLANRCLPCEVGAVGRDIHNPGLNQLILDLRKSEGARYFARGESGKEYMRFLREGNFLGILGDIDTISGDGVFVDYFGKPAWTQKGISGLARLGRARIIPVFMFRDGQNPAQQVMRFEEALPEFEEIKDSQQWTLRMTQSFTDAIEKAVREQPEQWMWIHRRWRHRPEDLEKLKRRRARRKKRMQEKKS